MLGFLGSRAQTCASPKTVTLQSYSFSSLDSFYLQPCFVRFNAPANKISAKVFIKKMNLYPTYDFKLYRDSCANLAGNLLSPTVTITGDTAYINYDNFVIGNNYLLRMKNNNVSPPDTISRYTVGSLSMPTNSSSIGTCPSSITPSSCELVCNGSFENLITSTLVATIGAGIYTSQLFNAYGWGNANDATADLFWNSGSPNAGNGVPCNWWGTQAAHTGGVYAGIITAASTDYGEYIETQLASTMVAGTKYEISMYVSRSDFQNRNNADIGIYLTNTVIAQTNLGHLTNTPNAVFSTTATLNDATNWQKVSFCYTATGNENYLTIGQTTSVVPSSISAPTVVGTCTAPSSILLSSPSSYLYIDDVSVTPLTASVAVTTGSCLNVPSSFSLAGACFTASTYNWNFGDGNTLVNGGLNPSHSYTSTGTFTISVTTTVNCGVITTTTTINTPTCVYCSSASSTLSAFSGTAFPSSPSGLTYSTAIVFNNNVTIPAGQTVTFSDAEFLFAPYVKIIVSPGAELKMRGTHLYGCGANLWQGIVVQDGGRVSSIISGSGAHNLVEDALIAIDVSGHTTSTLTSILSLNKTTFNKNYVGIKVDNYKRVSANYPFAITECVFTCRTLTYTPTSWPTTSETSPGLRYIGASTPTSGLVAPYPLQSAIITNLKAPYAAQYASAGILLNDVGRSTVYYGIDIGSANSASDFNLFDAMTTGIDATNSNVSSINNAFQNALRYDTLVVGPFFNYSVTIGGTAIRSNVTTDLNARLNMSATGTYSTNYSVGNRFWDCYRAVHASNLYKLDCNYATFRSTQTTSNVAALSFFPGNNGVLNETNRFDHNIRYCNFNNITNPVIINIAPGTYTYAATSYTGVLANNIYINYNYFGAQLTNTTTLGSAYINTAVYIGASSTTGWNNIASNGLQISANEVNRAFRGFYIDAYAGSAKTETNTITLLNDATYSVTQRGISAGSVPGISIAGNNISAVNTTNTLVTLVYVGASPSCAVLCNTTYTAYQGFEFNSNSGSSNWHGNNMTSLGRGLVLSNGGIIGTQGASGSPSGNKWNGTWSGGDNGTYVDGSSNAVNSKLWVKSTGGIYFPPNWGGITPSQTYSVTTNWPTTTGNYACGSISPPARMVFSAPDQTAARGNNSNNINSVENMQFIADNIFYRYLDANPEIKNSQQDYIDFYNSKAGSSIDLFTQTEKALSNSDFAQAQNLNNSFSISNTVEENYNNFYKLHAGYQQNNFSEEDNGKLLNLALMCPGKDGSIVYQARALYNLINKTNKVFNDHCINEGEQLNERSIGVSENKKAWNVDIYPNPTNGHLNIISKSEKEELAFVITDVSGKKVYTSNLVTVNFIGKLEVDLINGLYLVTITNNKHESSTKKLVIAK